MESKPLCSSQMPPRTDRPEDEELSSLSDYDSEWTQVSGAEDDSDFPPLTAASDRPLSRADTLDGSVDGDLWEGFIDDTHRSFSQSSDQIRPLVVDLELDATDEESHETQPVGVTPVPETDDHDSVNDALDSELIGTLKASRARSASSLHTSLTESQSKLRLSFPDPLSSTEDLDIDSAAQEGRALLEPDKEHCESSAAEDASSFFEDIHTPLTPSDSETPSELEPAALPIPVSASCALSLFLYGSASSSKWQIAERIMRLVLRRTDGAQVISRDGSQRDYYFNHPSLLDDTAYAENEQIFFVRVLDRTSNSSEMKTPEVDQLVPSVAILLLPSRLPAVLPRHKFYLPLISASSLDFGSESPVISSTFSEQVMVDSAHYTWKQLDLPTEDTIVLDRRRPHAILDAAALESIDPDALVQAFSIVLNDTKEANLAKTCDQMRLSTNRWKTLALIAATLLAFTAGGIQVTRNSLLTPVTANSTSTGVTDGPTPVLDPFRTVATFVVPADHLIQATHSLPRTVATTAAKTTVRSTPRLPESGSEPSKLAVVTHVDTSVSLSSLTGSPSPMPSTCRSRARSWVDKFNLSLGEYIPRELIVWPVDTFGIASKKSALIPKPVRNPPSDKASRGNSVKSLSLRTMQNSLAVVSSKGKALKTMAGKDLSVIYEAIDELLRSLHQQMDNMKGELKGTQSVTQSGFSVRNARARENARRLRRAGEHLFQAAGKCLRNKGEEAIHAARQAFAARKGQAEEKARGYVKRRQEQEKEEVRNVKRRQLRGVAQMNNMNNQVYRR